MSVVSLFLTEAQRPPLIQEKACALSNSNGFTVLVPGTNSRCLTIMASATCVDEIIMRYEIEVHLQLKKCKAHSQAGTRTLSKSLEGVRGPESERFIF